MGQVIMFPALNHPQATRKPYDHGHFLNSDGRCDLCQVRSLAEVMAERERRQREWDEMRRLGLK